MVDIAEIIADAERRVHARMLRAAVRMDFFGGLHVDPNKVPVTAAEARAALAQLRAMLAAAPTATDEGEGL